MACLAIELSPQPCSLALQLPGESGQAAIFEREFSGERGRALLAEIDGLCSAASIQKTELARIVVGLGPGSYTGLRIACTAARSLSFALQIPCGGMSSFEAALYQLEVGQSAHIALDAFRGEVYHAIGTRTATDVSWQQQPQVRSLDAWQADIEADAIVLCDERLEKRIQAGELESEASWKICRYAPKATALLALTAERGAHSLAAVEPMYLRAAAFRPSGQ